MNKPLVKNIWTDVSLEVLHQRLAFNNADLLATDDSLLDSHVLACKKEIQNRLSIIWNKIHPPKLQGECYTVLELLEICSHKGFQQMLVEKNINEHTLPDTKIFVSEKELESYK
jgi:hypothetical protein